MSVTLANLETIIRNLINDNEVTKVPGDLFTYTSSTSFTLTEPNINSVTALFQNDVELGSGDWSYDSSTGKLSVTATLTYGDNIEVQYTYYENYSSTEIYAFIKSALVHLSTNNYATYEVVSNTLYPEPCREDKNLISLIAATIIKPGNVSYALPDIKITVPDDVPLDQKIRQIISKFKMGSTHGIFDIAPTDVYI